MRIQLVILLLLSSLSAFATDEKSVKELFSKYQLVMGQKKTELIDEVFSKKFIETSGGKKELIEKIKELPLNNEKTLAKQDVSWRKGLSGKNIYAKVKELTSDKSKKESKDSEFIIVNEEGKLKIDGTIGDAN
jgi:hypothetical protein